MKKLDIEETDEYLEAQNTIKFMELVKQYYETNSNFDELDLGNISIREVFKFMSEHGFPKRGFISDQEKKEIIIKIQDEIKNINKDLKKARIQEIEDRQLNSLLIIPSWSKVIGYETKGFYLNKPVLELKKDSIIMLSYDILTVEDKLGTELALLTGPGIFFTEFSLTKGSYIINSREINMIMLPMDKLEKLLEAPPIFKSDIDATMNELISIIPFMLIEEAYSVQAILRGVISRNIFHPNKSAFDTYLQILEDPNSFNPNEGYKILSAHELYFNRLLLTQPPKKAAGDESFNIASAGIAAILPTGQALLDEVMPDAKTQSEILLKFRDIKREFNKVGKKLLHNWMP
ncbi:MAG: hypothetical protein OEY49_16285 [Candidatus Heimdallarchaeota archaeon]|nr:hypothetical protein [Candidatus Heimdallarchaeota archaeon]